MWVGLSAAFVAATLMAASAATAEPPDAEISAARPADGASPPPGPLSYPEDAAAQYRLGLRYETGREAPQDYGEAVACLMIVELKAGNVLDQGSRSALRSISGRLAVSRPSN